jgi:hypothetical protein
MRLLTYLLAAALLWAVAATGPSSSEPRVDPAPRAGAAAPSSPRAAASPAHAR